MHGVPAHHYTIQRLQGRQRVGVVAKTDNCAAPAWCHNHGIASSNLQSIWRWQALLLPSCPMHHHRRTLSVHPSIQRGACKQRAAVRRIYYYAGTHLLVPSGCLSTLIEVAEARGSNSCHSAASSMSGLQRRRQSIGCKEGGVGNSKRCSKCRKQMLGC